MKLNSIVRVNLKEVIKKEAKKKRKNEVMLSLWRALDGKEGVVVEIDGDDIWVKGKNKGVVRLFNKEVLEEI